MQNAEYRISIGAPFQPHTNGVESIRSDLLAKHNIDLKALKESLKNTGTERQKRFRVRKLEEYFTERVSAHSENGQESLPLYTSAAQTLRRAIEAAGVEEHPWGREHLFFSGRTDRHAVIGNQDIIDQVIVPFIESREKGNGNENRILLIIGKQGSGKSTVADAVKWGYEEFVANSDPPLSAISGCPVNEDPANTLSLVPDINSQDKLQEHSLCPGCKECLRKKLENDPTRFQVEALDVSVAEGIGIVKLTPDITRDFALAYKLTADSNRGILEVAEYAKHGDGYRRELAEIMSTRTIALVTADLKTGEPIRREYKLDHLVIATTTVKEWEEKRKQLEQDFPGELRRITEVLWPYVTSLKDEVKIYRKAIGLSEFRTHVSQTALEGLAKIALRTRLLETPYKKGAGNDAKEIKVTAEDKLVLYDGEDTETLTQKDRQLIQKAAREQKEGMNGISPTIMTDILFAAMAKNPNCISPIDVLNQYEFTIRTNSTTLQSELNKTSMDLIAMSQKVRGEYETWLVVTVRKAMRLDYDAAINTEFKSYMDNAELWAQPNDPEVIAAVKSNNSFEDTDEVVVADEQAMRKVEEAIGISENAKKKFRETQLGICASIERSRGRLKYELSSFAELKKAIERKVGSELDQAMLDLFTTRIPSQDQIKRRQEIANQLKLKYDFCDDCVQGAQDHTQQLLTKLDVSQNQKKQ